MRLLFALVALLAVAGGVRADAPLYTIADLKAEPKVVPAPKAAPVCVGGSCAVPKSGRLSSALSSVVSRVHSHTLRDRVRERIAHRPRLFGRCR